MQAHWAGWVVLLCVCDSAAGQIRSDSEPSNVRAVDSIAERIATLIEQLGDERFDAREAASQGLTKIGHRARAALEQATKNSDAEISSRALAILDQLPKLTHTIVDALGQPIPLASVNIEYLKKDSPAGGLNPADDLPSNVVAFQSEEDGRIAIPTLAALPATPFPGEQATAAGFTVVAIVQHVDYGKARIELGAPGQDTVLRLPLVRRGTEAYERALKGQVLTSDGKAVAGAVIQCSEVRTPGQGLIEGLYPRGEALSDDEGRFVYYLPPSEVRRTERGALIPANSRYGLHVITPSDDSLFPWTGRYSNLEPARIELPSVTRFHRFRFEAAAGGWITDPKDLQQVRVQLDRMEEGERLPISLSATAAKTGHKLVTGTYTAESFVNGKRVEYLPVVVRDDSPEELTFALPHAVTFRGRVTHGVSGAAVENAIVIGWNSTSHNNLAMLTAEDWKMLADAPSNPPTDHPAMKRLREFYGVQGLVQTDSEGRFEIIQPPDQEFYGLLAFAKDFVPFRVRLGGLKADEMHQVDTGDLPLFPAAKIVVRPLVDGGRLSVSPRWLPATAGQPEWFERFQALGRSSDREFEYVHWLQPNETQPVFVPADLRLNVRFETPYDDQWGSTVVESIHLEAGSVKEVGDLRFAQNLPIAVRVVDSSGKGVEGIPVRQKDPNDNAWSVAHNTDGEGVARFFAPPNSETEFRIVDLGGAEEDRKAKNLTVKFQMQESAPAEPATLAITDAQRDLLLGSNRTR